MAGLAGCNAAKTNGGEMQLWAGQVRCSGDVANLSATGPLAPEASSSAARISTYSRERITCVLAARFDCSALRVSGTVPGAVSVRPNKLECIARDLR